MCIATLFCVVTSVASASQTLEQSQLFDEMRAQSPRLVILPIADYETRAFDTQAMLRSQAILQELQHSFQTVGFQIQDREPAIQYLLDQNVLVEAALSVPVFSPNLIDADSQNWNIQVQNIFETTAKFDSQTLSSGHLLQIAKQTNAKYAIRGRLFRDTTEFEQHLNETLGFMTPIGDQIIYSGAKAAKYEPIEKRTLRSLITVDTKTRKQKNQLCLQIVLQNLQTSEIVWSGETLLLEPKTTVLSAVIDWDAFKYTTQTQTQELAYQMSAAFAASQKFVRKSQESLVNTNDPYRESRVRIKEYPANIDADTTAFAIPHRTRLGFAAEEQSELEKLNIELSRVTKLAEQLDSQEVDKTRLLEDIQRIRQELLELESVAKK
jgi:hypothetical protein